MQESGFLLLMTKSMSYQMLTTDCNTGTGISSDLSWKNFEEIYVTKVLREGVGGGRGDGVVPYAKHQKLVFFAPCKLP